MPAFYDLPLAAHHPLQEGLQKGSLMLDRLIAKKTAHGLCVDATT